MAIPGHIEYQRREYCKDIQCPIQGLLERQPPDTPAYAEIRRICAERCIHTTFEFHHGLIEKGYRIVRPDH